MKVNNYYKVISDFRTRACDLVPFDDRDQMSCARATVTVQKLVEAMPRNVHARISVYRKHASCPGEWPAVGQSYQTLDSIFGELDDGRFNPGIAS